MRSPLLFALGVLMADPVRVAIAGAAGRMGKMLIETVGEEPSLVTATHL